MKTGLPAAATAVLLALPPAATVLAQSPRGTAEATVGTTSISIEYGRPSLRGRDMLAQVTDGMVWRLGADQSTTLTTSGDLHFAGAVIRSGSYSLYARKTGDGWVLLVNSQTGQWGTEHDPANDLAEIPLNPVGGGSLEQFTITIDGHEGEGTMQFHWGETALTASFHAN